MRRLPLGIILRTQVVNKIILDEYPAPADFRAGNIPATRFACERHWVNLQELRSFCEHQRIHGGAAERISEGFNLRRSVGAFGAGFAT